MLKQFTATPKIENGYLLEPNMGWFSVVQPIAKTNLIINPNLVEYSTYDTNFSTLNATVTEIADGVFSPTGVNVASISGQARQLLYKHPDILSGTYTFSFYAKANAGGPVTIIMGGTNAVVADTKEIFLTNEWERYYMTTTLIGQNFGGTFFSIWSDDTDFQVTAMQVEEGTLTTFFSGYTDIDLYDGDNAYQWAGQPFQSVSYRSESAFSGGEQVSLFELGFKVTSIEGLGYPDLDPILHEQALFDSRLFACSSIEPRDISINGILIGCSFKDFMCKRGSLGHLLFQSKRPVRIYFTPYDFCDDDIPCVYFDFVYTSGLNEEIDSWFGQELSIEGTTLTTCINSCAPYTYNSLTFNDMQADIGTDSEIYFITDDNEIIPADFPKFTTGTLQHNDLMGAVSCGGEIYAIITQSTGTTEEDHFVKYNGVSWERIATTRRNFSRPGTPLSSISGYMTTIECVGGTYSSGVYVGGYFYRDDLSVYGSTNLIDSPLSGSLFRYEPDTKDLYFSGVRMDDGTGAGQPVIGTVSEIYYDKNNNDTYIGGAFSLSHVYLGTSLKVLGSSPASGGLMYINNAKPNIAQAFNITYDKVSGAMGNTTRVDNDVLVITKIIRDNDDLYIAGNLYREPYNPKGFANDAFIYHYFVTKYPTSITLFRALQTVPFNGRPLELTPDGGVTDIYKYGEGYFVVGEFTMAASDYNRANNDTTYVYDSGYMYNVGWLDPRGYARGLNSFSGRFAPLEESIDTMAQDYGIGIYTDSINGNPRPTIRNSGTDTKITHFNGNILFTGHILGYGPTNAKTAASGFVEYLPLSTTNLTNGVFVPASLAIDDPAFIYPELVTFDDVYNIKAILSGPQVLYNTGVTINTCDSNSSKNATIIVQSSNGISTVAGVRNLSTGKSIYFTPFDIPANTLLKMDLSGQTVRLTFSNGTVSKVDDIVNTGNPFSVNDGDILQVVFDLVGTNAIANNNPVFTVRTTDCYMSIDEAMYCEDCDN